MEGRTLYQWFADTVRRHPDRPALELDDRVLSYRELRDLAVGIAARLVAEHGGTPARIALAASRSVEAYAGFLAAQRLGAALLPLNPEHPERRNLDIAQRTGVEAALVGPDGAGAFAALPPRLRPTVVGLGDGSAAVPPVPPEAAALPPAPADLERVAYVLFTSGSSGAPKGVPIRHRGLAPYLAYNIARYEVAPGSRLSQVFGLTFDACVFDMFVSWGAGATLVVPGSGDLYSPVEFARRRRLTHWFSVPSVITVAQQLDNLPAGRATTLRHSLFGAEPVTVKHAELWRSAAPHTEIHNLYGPTETTITCTDHRLTGPRSRWTEGSNGTVPIGRPYPHVEAVVLDDGGRPAGEGELCLRGPQRFDGYLDPKENAGRFTRFEHGGGPAVVYDGGEPLTPAHWYRTGDRVRWEGEHLVHLGRLDQQVKLMGHRVEIGEVEAAMHRNPNVVEVAVVAVSSDGQTRLAAAYSGSPLPEADFFHWLRREIPLHMIPSRIEHFERLPLNDNGKIDRRRLAELLA